MQNLTSNLQNLKFNDGTILYQWTSLSSPFSFEISLFSFSLSFFPLSPSFFLLFLFLSFSLSIFHSFILFFLTTTVQLVIASYSGTCSLNRHSPYLRTNQNNKTTLPHIGLQHQHNNNNNRKKQPEK